MAPPRGRLGLALAGATFVLGLAVGSAIGPLHAGRGSAPPPAAEAPASVPAFAQPPALRGVHPAQVLRIHDGDTFEARVHLWPGLDVTTRVRLRGIDAPEMRARCAEERDKAEAARDALRAILA